MTLLLGLAALVTSKKTYSLPVIARPWIYVSMGLFVAAAVIGLLTNRPVTLKAATVGAMKDLARNKWDYEPDRAARLIFVTRADLIDGYKAANAGKARLLGAAVVAEILAICALAVAVGLIVNHG